jgi:site-specific recombinase XerD
MDGLVRFVDIRDRAILMFFRSTGARRSEVANLRVTDIDLDQLAAIVTGKASRMRIVRFDAATGLALTRYLRARKNQRHAASEMLWIGVDGALNPDAFNLLFGRRSERAGIRVNPHRFRHDFSHRYLAAGGQETDLMQQNGWTSREMLQRYGASAAAERARQHYDGVMQPQTKATGKLASESAPSSGPRPRSMTHGGSSGTSASTGRPIPFPTWSR